MDFLTFRSFISIDILILSYYIGAIVIPIVMWLSKSYLQKKIALFDRANQMFMSLFSQLNLKNRIISILLMFFMFISMEIVWRMCFEAMIGYFQMIESLKA
ncbi:MAG: DUF4282 domain-containing protein [Epsilonproteobacteria bacterium]|nr:DUF4282 domain-containing protein [Campylobacterota bacterium]